MKKTMMYLPEEMHAYLADEAKRRGVTMAEVAREAIAHYRTQHAAPPLLDLSAVVGIIEDDSVDVDLASRVDELMDEYYAAGGGWDEEHGRAGDR